MGLNEKGKELILVIKEIFRTPEDLPIHVATVLYETKSMRSQAKAIVSFPHYRSQSHSQLWDL